MTKFTWSADLHEKRKSASWNPISRFLMCWTLSSTLLAQTLSNIFLFWFQWEPITAQTFNHVTKVDGAHWMMYRKLSSWTGLRHCNWLFSCSDLDFERKFRKKSFKIEIEEDLQKLSRNEKRIHKVKARCVRAVRKAFAKAWAKLKSRGFFPKLFQSYYQRRVGFVLNDGQEDGGTSRQDNNNYKIMRLPIWFSCSCPTLLAKKLKRPHGFSCQNGLKYY